jgi:hypothetical protein
VLAFYEALLLLSVFAGSIAMGIIVGPLLRFGVLTSL